MTSFLVTTFCSVCPCPIKSIIKVLKGSTHAWAFDSGDRYLVHKGTSCEDLCEVFEYCTVRSVRR